MKKLNRYILKFKNKEIENIKDENVTLKFLDKYTEYLIVFIFVCLFWIKFIHIYFSNHLVDNIYSYVAMFNYNKDNSFIFLFTISNYNIVIKKKNYVLCFKNKINNIIASLSFHKFIIFIWLKLNLIIYS